MWQERLYPLQVTQVVKSAEEKAASQAKAEATKASQTLGEKCKPAIPPGCKNKIKQEVILNPEAVCIQTALQSLLNTIEDLLFLKYVVLNRHFGNSPSAFMVRWPNLHLISKMGSDFALYEAHAGQYLGRGGRSKYSQKLDVYRLDDGQYLKATSTEKNILTKIYQGTCYNKEFPFALSVVVILKTNMLTHTQADVGLFSTNLELDYEKIIKYYSLRFQLEFNFRAAKQYWRLEDFMNVKETALGNAAKVYLFMVNLSYDLLQPFREHTPDYSVLNLKASYRSLRYSRETIKMLPQKPDDI